MREHPEDVEWLKNKLDPSLFEKFKEQLDRKPRIYLGPPAGYPLNDEEVTSWD
jgi:hypothetical protein